MRSTKIAQLAVYLGMYTNAIAFTIIFPFGSLMVQDFGLATDRSTTGYWVGVLGFALMGSRVVSSPLWGSFCDRYGRRPAALFGALAVTVFSLTFGMSQNYWMAVASRALLGGLCCSSLVGKAIMNELTHGRPTAMGWTVMSWQMGNISGNIFGGLFGGKQFGGLVQRGKATIVGEAGPELFVPSTTGSIVPNHRLGGGGSPTVVQNITINAGVPEAVRREVFNLMPFIKQEAAEGVIAARNRGGAMAFAMGVKG